MPLGRGVRYRVKDGVRLAFRGDKVIETKNLKTGATHMVKSRLPAGVSLSPKGDLGEARQKECAKVFTRAIKRAGAPVVPSKALPVRRMQLPK